MTNYNLEKVITTLGYFHNEINVLIDLVNQYERADYGDKTSIQIQLKEKFKKFKDDLKKQIKVLIEYDANLLIADYLLPPLSVAYIHLQDIGINRINPNSIYKFSQYILKANEFITRYYTQLLRT